MAWRAAQGGHGFTAPFQSGGSMTEPVCCLIGLTTPGDFGPLSFSRPLGPEWRLKARWHECSSHPPHRWGVGKRPRGLPGFVTSGPSHDAGLSLRSDVRNVPATGQAQAR